MKRRGFRYLCFPFSPLLLFQAVSAGPLLDKALEREEAGVHFAGGLVALIGGIFAGFEDDLVQPAQQALAWLFEDGSRHFGEQPAVPAHCGLIEHLAQSIDIRRGGARPFGRDVALGAQEGNIVACAADVGDQADVGELRRSVDVDDVRGFDVAVDEAVTVQFRQGVRERARDAHCG